VGLEMLAISDIPEDLTIESLRELILDKDMFNVEFSVKNICSDYLGEEDEAVLATVVNTLKLELGRLIKEMELHNEWQSLLDLIQAMRQPTLDAPNIPKPYSLRVIRQGFAGAIPGDIHDFYFVRIGDYLYIRGIRELMCTPGAVVITPYWDRPDNKKLKETCRELFEFKG
jgi:hypothetical protein